MNASSPQGASAPKEAKSSYRIAVIGGDGTGPEVVREGLKVLNVAARKH